MPDRVIVMAALAAGLAAALAVWTLGDRPEPMEAAAWLARRRGAEDRSLTRGRELSGALSRARWRPPLAGLLFKAGWSESPERMAAATAAASCALALAGTVSGMWLHAPGVAGGLGLAGLAAGPAIAYGALLGSIRRRRRLLLGELAPTLELVGLEMSSGASAFGALSAISTRTTGALAGELRQILVASQLAGSATVDARIDELGIRLGLPALRSLAALLGTTRAYGSGALEGVRALAADLRRAQRRELIAISRRALNRVLIPSAVGVLLPFLAILLFPAVTALMASFR
jgi:Flp pilus assembly protein TadB